MEYKSSFSCCSSPCLMADVHLSSTVQYDMTWVVVSLLKKLGLASNVKLPYVALSPLLLVHTAVCVRCVLT